MTLLYMGVTPAQISALRRELKLSPEEFAAAAVAGQFNLPGRKRPRFHRDGRITVWRWETGKRSPSEQTIMLMKRL